MSEKLGVFADSKAAPKVSVVIPTWNHLEDLLKPCLESLVRYTDPKSVEVVVVANGCSDGTEEYVGRLGYQSQFNIHYVSFCEPLGFPRAANEGIKLASGDYIVLLNNDTVLLEQERNAWIDMLLRPFLEDPWAGMAAPVKFHWTCGKTRRSAMAFWCVMFPKRLWQGEIGPLDEIFSPGTGEDGDWSIKVEEAGYRLVQVPIDGSSEFGTGIPNQIFPIMHKGSGTFGAQDHSKLIERNSKILVDRYGEPKEVDAVYREILRHPCDVNLLFPALRTYARQSRRVTEFGMRDAVTVWAFLAARPQKVTSYDIYRSPNVEGVSRNAKAAGVDFEFRQEDVVALNTVIESTDLLYIDTKHTYAQLKVELMRHSPSVSRWILIHDTETYGEKGEDGGPGELQAISEFLKEIPGWKLREHYAFSNGLTVLERHGPKVSIVIPTCGKDWKNVLRKCLGAVFEYTNLAHKEVIVVANGAPDDVLAYLEPLHVQTLAFPQPVGYIRAVNAGIEAARGEFVVTLDDDSFLNPQNTDEWIRLLKKPFEDPQVGAAGPFMTSYDDLGDVLHSGCTMYRRELLEKLGRFDEAFNPGYMGDEDLAIRIRKAGYRLVEVPEGQARKYVDGIFQLKFPVVHMGNVNTMPKNTTDLPLVKKNRDLLYGRHGKQMDPGQAILEANKMVKALGCPIGNPGELGAPGSPLVTIIIPTYKNNFRTDEHGVKHNLLKRNLETLALYTDLVGRNIEVLVVCNGCTDGQEEYVKSLGRPFRVISFPEPLGYTKATNEGIKASRSPYLLFLNDDVELLPQPKNQWFNWLIEPFLDDPMMGVTGPLQLHDDYANSDVIIGFCLMTSREVMQKVMVETSGLLDEVFSPGGGEDVDLCAKMHRAGYKVRQVPREGKLGFSHTNTGDFMIWHVNNQTLKDMPEYTRWYVKRNGLVNLRRYNRDVKLNLGAGGIEYPGYLSVDLYDERANIIMDITKLDLEPGTVSEIMALHVFEHLNPYHCADTLKLWRKLLKPGGKLVMEMPDLLALCRRFVEAEKEDPKNPTGVRYGIANAIYGSVNTTAKGAPSEITSPHLFGWWEQSLWDILTNAGYVDVVFKPEQHKHPESNLRVEATNPGTLVEAAAPALAITKRMKDLWRPPDHPVAFGEETTYKKAMDFLCGCDKVEDWGCGSGYAKKFMKEGVYVGVDGSSNKAVSVHTELAEYRSVTEGILLRHVLDHNPDWKLILENAVASFTRKMVIILCTPFSEETHRIAANWEDIPDLSFRREDILGQLQGLQIHEETLKTATQYGQEHLFYVSRR